MGPRFALSGRLVRVSADQTSQLQVGELVLDKFDKNPTYLGRVTAVNQPTPFAPAIARVEWLKWYNESYSLPQSVESLIRLEAAD